MAALTLDPKYMWAQIENLGMRRLMWMGGSLIGLAAVLYFLLGRGFSPAMVPLYQGGDPQDTNKVIEILGAQGIDFKMEEGQIQVPEPFAMKARMSLAESGISSRSVVGYEIFDKSDVLGTTHFVQNVNLLRALEGELSRTIQTLQNVASARVHIVMPERRLFEKEKRIPSAAIVLRLRGARRLESEQVQAIQYLVSSSVPDMKTSKVSILDDRGVLLASGSDPSGGNAMEFEERKSLYEARLGRMVESLLEETLGSGNVRAEVSAEFDNDRITEQSESFDPEGQVVRSQQNSSDRNSSGSNTQNQPTTVQQEIPNIPKTGGGGEGAETQGEKADETINYEISKTVRTAVREIGAIKHLSVAVLVNGVHAKNEDGEATYADRSAEEMQKIKRLVQAVVGYREDRGDVIDVVNLKFQKHPDLQGADGSWWENISQENWMRLAQMALLGFLGLLLFLLGIKPVLAQMVSGKNSAEAALAAAGGAEGQKGQTDADGATAGEGTETGAESGATPLSASDQRQLRGWESLPEDELTDLVNKFVQSDPERAVSVLRIWMKG